MTLQQLAAELRKLSLKLQIPPGTVLARRIPGTVLTSISMVLTSEVLPLLQRAVAVDEFQQYPRIAQAIYSGNMHDVLTRIEATKGMKFKLWGKPDLLNELAKAFDRLASEL